MQGDDGCWIGWYLKNWKFENLRVEFEGSEIAMNKFIINQIFVKRETFNVSN